MKQWKKFVGYDHCNQNSVGLEDANPGAVDNSALFRGIYFNYSKWSIMSCFNQTVIMFRQHYRYSKGPPNGGAGLFPSSCGSMEYADIMVWFILQLKPYC